MEAKVLDELHSYCRHTMQLWVQWFTFFLTVNYVALGWFAGEISEKGLRDRRPLNFVAELFISQNVLGILICFITRRFFVRTGLSLEAQHRKLGIFPPAYAQGFYAMAVMVGALAMLLVAVCWALFALFS